MELRVWIELKLICVDQHQMCSDAFIKVRHTIMNLFLSLKCFLFSCQVFDLRFSMNIPTVELTVFDYLLIFYRNKHELQLLGSKSCKHVYWA